MRKLFAKHIGAARKVDGRGRDGRGAPGRPAARPAPAATTTRKPSGSGRRNKTSRSASEAVSPPRTSLSSRRPTA
jgi:hypothetical protein